MTVGYIAYAQAAVSVEAEWLADQLSCAVELIDTNSNLNLASHENLPEPARLSRACERLRAHPWLVAEGPGGFLWAALARAAGFSGAITVLPYLNPTSWFDLSAIAVYRKFADQRDRVFIGSTPSARLYRSLRIDATVAEPFGIDCDVFYPRRDASATLAELSIVARGPMLLFAGRAEPDKDLHRLLSVALKAQLLFPDLQVIVATHVVNKGYMSLLERLFTQERRVRLVVNPNREQLADLYSAADVFATASTSHYETFGRAPAEALACGTVAIAPRYDGFVDVLAQPGGRLVDVEFEDDLPRANESMFLRAIYEALSSPVRVTADEISTVARERFCRPRTLRVLNYLSEAGFEAMTESKLQPDRGGSESGPPDLPLPHEWQAAVQRIEAMRGRDALSYLWNWREHRKLSVLDNSFRATVRRTLANAGSSVAEPAVGIPICP